MARYILQGEQVGTNGWMLDLSGDSIASCLSPYERAMRPCEQVTSTSPDGCILPLGHPGICEDYIRELVKRPPRRPHWLDTLAAIAAKKAAENDDD